MQFKVLYEDNDVLVVDKPAGVSVFREGQITEKTLIDYLVEEKWELENVGQAPRYGVVHRLDKNTSGVLLVAKTTEALLFLQKQFKNREVEKKYVALATGVIKEDSGTVETFVGRSKSNPRKQVVLGAGTREAITEWKVLERFANYTLLEVRIKTGRRHQIRVHLAHIHHPIAGDTLYGFKDSPKPAGLHRQFLHASYVKIKLPSGNVHEFHSALPDELQIILDTL